MKKKGEREKNKRLRAVTRILGKQFPLVTDDLTASEATHRDDHFPKVKTEKKKPEKKKSVTQRKNNLEKKVTMTTKKG